VLSKTQRTSRLGAKLVKKGLLSTHDLYSLIQQQIEEIFYSVLLVGEGQFFFYREKSENLTRGPRRLSTQNLLMSGVQRIDEMSYFREKIPSSNVVFERVWSDMKPTKLQDSELLILELVDGTRTLDDISKKSRFGEFETTKAVFQLLQSGLIRSTASDGMGTAGREAKKGGLWEVSSLFNDVFARLFQEAALQDRSDQLVKAASSFFEATNDYNALFNGVAHNNDGTLDTERLVSNTESCDVADKVDYLYQGLNEFLFFQTFIAGETLDAETEEKLHGRLSAIIEDNADTPKNETDSELPGTPSPLPMF
jgi:hypothetical protein